MTNLSSEQEIAVRLTVAAIEWLQRQKDIALPRDIDSLGGSVGQLYQSILKRVLLAKEPRA